jgi:hypothetical protein
MDQNHKVTPQDYQCMCCLKWQNVQGQMKWIQFLLQKKNWLSQGDKAPKFLGIVQWWTQQASSTNTIQSKILQGNWNLIGKEICECSILGSRCASWRGWKLLYTNAKKTIDKHGKQDSTPS